ncbi:MAG: RNA polymerase sigma factor, partial [Ignavibacteria bacterium]|nr:RNA polymerase sigma factor [Ignavibacteria bacterium]
QLVQLYDRSVLSIAMRFVNDVDEAKDIYQEVFIRVFKGLKNFEFRSEFSTWIFRVTTNVCLTHKSNKKEQMRVSIYDDSTSENDDFSFKEIMDEGISPEEETSFKNLGELIDEAVDNLSERQKITFILKHYEGYKIREIAEMLNCKEGTVKKYLFDAIKNLKKKLKPLMVYQT